MESFNPKNGQIFTETKSSRVRSMIPTWKKHVTGRRVNPQSHKDKANRCRTLRDMAMRSCCWNVELFMPEALKDPGWHYAGMIYRQLKATDTLTFLAWTLFQQAYPSQTELKHAFRIGNYDSITSWPSITKSLSTLNSNVLTHFCAYGIYLDLLQLISLTNIPTLAALVQITEPPGRHNSLSRSSFRNWCRAVREKKALQSLRLLFLSSISEDEPLDATDIRNLASFPALTLVGIVRTQRLTGRLYASRNHNGWVRPDPRDEDKYTGLVWGSRCSISEKTELLHEYAKSLSPPEREDDSAVTLSLTCAAEDSLLRDRSTAWFVRDPASTETQPKRLQDAPTLQDGSDRAIKKRKVRQGKQLDVGSLLGMFD